MSFPLAGNKRVKESVEALISAKRLPHAIIIEGDSGTGKRTLARYLAKVAVCDGDTPPCGGCRNCHLADAGTHPDIEVVAPEEKKKNIAVDQIRNLRTIAYLSAHTARRRAFIIEQASTMNASSQNSLLKVLEEPPSDVLFLLLTESAEDLLETVVSRCLTVSLFPPSLEEGLAYLEKSEGIKPDKAEPLLREEGNNVGRTLARLKSGSSDRAGDRAREFFEAIEKGNALEAMLVTVPMEKNRPEADKFVSRLSELLALKVKEHYRFVQTAREYAEMFRVVEELKSTLERNIQLSLFFTALVSKLTSVKHK